MVRRLQRGAEFRMRSALGVDADVNDVLRHRFADGGRQGPTIMGMASDAAAAHVILADLAHVFLEDRIAGFGMFAGFEIGMVQAPAEHERLGVDRRDVCRHLLEAGLGFVGILLVHGGASPQPGFLGHRERIEAAPLFCSAVFTSSCHSQGTMPPWPTTYRSAVP